MLYESGCSPFKPDTNRGYWVNPNDFIYAGLGLAFRLDMFSLPWFYILDSNIISFFIVYLIALFIYIPFIVIQSFLGQFSSSGFISAFRVTPLFKGIGYITLALNICVLSFYSNYAVIPLVYMFGSLQPTLPWSCEGYKKWAIDDETTICDLPGKNETMASYPDEYIYLNYHIPSVLYFKSLFNDIYQISINDVEFSMSWQLMVCAILVWTIVIIFFYKFFNTK
ncbi:sodium-dependent acetylcholine transporter-like, partial [Lucilia sericata]|uniref:sodium-dependent acetylcholine transporter-like n=1 Tax=Lucilia sericata TaxID=13632 RepID=UPI0018A835AB